ncbi:xylose isomerase-like protein [Kalaharituber pfeilii]|nr:xylose isomerase-like protein [Kalaharituber pfeilii]
MGRSRKASSKEESKEDATSRMRSLKGAVATATTTTASAKELVKDQVVEKTAPVAEGGGGKLGMKPAEKSKAGVKTEVKEVNKRAVNKTKREKKKKKKKKGKLEGPDSEDKSEGEEADDDSDYETSKHKTSKKRKRQTSPSPSTKKPSHAPKKPRMPPPSFSRTLTTHLLGAHVSAAGGPHNAVNAALSIGSTAFALFLKSQRKWNSQPLKDNDISSFKSLCVQMVYDPKKHIMPHGSYLVNLAQPDEEKWWKSVECFLDDLGRCEALGVGLYNFHPGSTLGNHRPLCIERIAKALNHAHKQTRIVKTVLENMASHGNIIGSTLEDLRDIISLVDDKSRVGVCIDTCHAFAAGYDLRTESVFNQFWEQFDQIVGKEYLSGMHLNDSKAPLGSRRDLHENIGRGCLGLEAFRLVMNCDRLRNVPMVLETPVEEAWTWGEEIKLLERLVGAKGDEEWFLKTSRKLQDEGRSERERVADMVRRREIKLEKEKLREAEGGKRRVKKKVVMAEGEKENLDRAENGVGEDEGKMEKPKAKNKVPAKRGSRKKKVEETQESDLEDGEEESPLTDLSSTTSLSDPLDIKPKPKRKTSAKRNAAGNKAAEAAAPNKRGRRKKKVAESEVEESESPLSEEDEEDGEEQGCCRH